LFQDIVLISLETPEGNRLPRRSRCRWKNIKRDLQEWDGEPCTGFIWIRTGTDGGNLWMW